MKWLCCQKCHSEIFIISKGPSAKPLAASLGLQQQTHLSSLPQPHNSSLTLLALCALKKIRFNRFNLMLVWFNYLIRNPWSPHPTSQKHLPTILCFIVVYRGVMLVLQSRPANHIYISSRTSTVSVKWHLVCFRSSPNAGGSFRSLSLGTLRSTFIFHKTLFSVTTNHQSERGRGNWHAK